jgi:hypothetical protein
LQHLKPLSPYSTFAALCSVACDLLVNIATAVTRAPQDTTAWTTSSHHSSLLSEFYHRPVLACRANIQAVAGRVSDTPCRTPNAGSCLQRRCLQECISFCWFIHDMSHEIFTFLEKWLIGLL